MFKNLAVAVLVVCGAVAMPQLSGVTNTLGLTGGSGNAAGTLNAFTINGITYTPLTLNNAVLNGLIPGAGALANTATAPLSFTSSSTGKVISAVDATNINNLSYQILSYLGLPVSALPGVVALITQILYLVDYGTTINFANGQLMIGGVSLPSYLTCQTFGSNLAACQICNYDCVYVHNTYGGSCQIDDSKATTGTDGAKGYTCVCQDERNANGTITPVQDVCGSIAGSLLDPVTSMAILQFLYVRQQAELCITLSNSTIVGAGCLTDCPRNHQYQVGTCEYTARVPFSPADDNTTAPNTLFCICDGAPDDSVYGTTAAPTTAAPTTAAPTTASS